jgi:hypothetical protein
MMALLSGAWWVQRLSGVAAQAIYIVAGISALVLGLFWLRHDARLDERKTWELRMANARIAAGIETRRREREADAIGRRAEKDLTTELDALEAINAKLEAKLAAIPIRTVCYPRDIIKELNR